MSQEGGLDETDPMFVFLLEARLNAEILKHEMIISDGNVKIQRLKERVQDELRTRKKLKAQFVEESQRKRTLEAGLNRLELYEKSASEDLMLMKVNMDADTRQRLMEEETCNNILKYYHDLWDSYKTEYEKFPLAVVRIGAKVDLEKARIKLMVESYKLNELRRMIRQKQAVDKIRFFGMTVECAKLWLERKQREHKLRILEETNRDLRKDLHINRNKLKVLRENEKQIATRRSSKVLMPPPIDLSFMLSVFAPSSQSDINSLSRIMQNNDCDTWETASINTLMFEEMLRSNVETSSESAQEAGVKEKLDDSSNNADQIKCGTFVQAESALCVNSCRELEGLRISEEPFERQQSQNVASTRQPAQKSLDHREDFTAKGPYRPEKLIERASDAKGCENEEYVPDVKRSKMIGRSEQELKSSFSTDVRPSGYQRKVPQIKMTVEPVNLTFPLISRAGGVETQVSSFFSSDRLYSDDYPARDDLSAIHMDISKDVPSISGASLASPSWGGFTPLRRGDSELESIASINFRKSPLTHNANATRQARPAETPVPGIDFSMLHTLHADKGKKKDDFFKMF